MTVSILWNGLRVTAEVDKGDPGCRPWTAPSGGAIETLNVELEDRCDLESFFESEFMSYDTSTAEVVKLFEDRIEEEVWRAAR